MMKTKTLNKIEDHLVWSLDYDHNLNEYIIKVSKYSDLEVGEDFIYLHSPSYLLKKVSKSNDKVLVICGDFDKLLECL